MCCVITCICHSFVTTHLDCLSTKVTVVQFHSFQCFYHLVSRAKIETITEMFRGQDADRLISDGCHRKPDFVLDCIDDINTKAELISYCLRKNLKIITSMGAGGKSDPTKLRIGSLSDCVKDPLASKIKWKLKKLNVENYDDVTTIYSCEKPICNLLALDDEQAVTPQDYGTADYLRV